MPPTLRKPFSLLYLMPLTSMCYTNYRNIKRMLFLKTKKGILLSLIKVKKYNILKTGSYKKFKIISLIIPELTNEIRT